jgi:ferredoxin-NADP reductase
LHDHFESGDIIEVGSPAGNFILDDSTQPIVMLSGGVGITPMMAMLDAQITALKTVHLNARFTSSMRRSSASQAFRRELKAMACRYDWLHLSS